MLKMIRKICIVIFVLSAAAYGGVTVYQAYTEDSSGPSIAMDSSEITVSVADDDSAVLEGITVRDADGSFISSNTVSDSLSAASALAETFTTVVDSEILESRVCSALGLSSLDGEISVSVVESTSLMTLTVNTSSPWLAYEMIQATMDAAVDLCREVSENITIRVLQEPSIPTVVSNPLD